MIDNLNTIFEHIPGWLPTDADTRAKALGKREDVIPEGPYCYQRNHDGSIANCPYWARDPDLPRQFDGYCALSGESDSSAEGVIHLWDQVKACGVRDDFD